MWGVGRGGDSLALIKFHARPHGKGCVCVCVCARLGRKLELELDSGLGIEIRIRVAVRFAFVFFAQSVYHSAQERLPSPPLQPTYPLSYLFMFASPLGRHQRVA